MSTLPRGIQAHTWTNSDGTQSMRYRVRVVRKDFKADNSYESLVEAAQFLALTKTASGREMLLNNKLQEEEQSKLKKQEEFKALVSTRRFLNSIDLFKERQVDKMPESDELERRNKANKLSFLSTIGLTKIQRPINEELTGGFFDSNEEIETETWTFGFIELSRLNAGDINAYIEARDKLGIKKSSISRELSIISQIIEQERTVNKSMRDKPNPALLYNKKLLKGAGTKPKVRITAQEEELIFSALREYSNPQMLQIVAFSLATAMRRSEIINLRWDMLNLNESRVELPKSKTGAREIHLTQQAFDLLKAVEPMENEPRVFWSYSTIAGFEGSFVKLMKEKLGIKHITFHTFRKEAISRFVEQLGAGNAPIIASFLGIRNVRKFEETYASQTPNNLDSFDAIRKNIGHKSKEVTIRHYYKPDFSTVIGKK